MTPEEKLQLTNLARLYYSLAPLIEELEKDVARANALREAMPRDQFARRVMIRCCAAWVEGTLAWMKPGVSQVASFFMVPLSQKELDHLLDQETFVNATGATEVKRRWPDFAKNVKKTFTLFEKAHGLSPTKRFECSEFNLLCETMKVRHRLMHPKTAEEFRVSDDDLRLAAKALRWYEAAFGQLIDRCKNRIPPF